MRLVFQIRYPSLRRLVPTPTQRVVWRIDTQTPRAAAASTYLHMYARTSTNPIYNTWLHSAACFVLILSDNLLCVPRALKLSYQTHCREISDTLSQDQHNWQRTRGLIYLHWGILASLEVFLLKCGMDAAKAVEEGMRFMMPRPVVTPPSIWWWTAAGQYLIKDDKKKFRNVVRKQCKD